MFDKPSAGPLLYRESNLMDMKNPSLLKAVTQALKHVTPESRRLAVEVDQRNAADVTEWEHEHPVWEPEDTEGQLS
jgi:hypothetical protein